MTQIKDRNGVWNYWHLRSHKRGWQLYHAKNGQTSGVFKSYPLAEAAWIKKVKSLFKSAPMSALRGR